MSKIEVNTIEPQSGTDVTIGASGDTLKVDTIASRTAGGRVALPDVNNYPPYRNIVINGDMRIDQRNNGSSQTNTGSTTYYLDRFVCLGTSSEGQFSIQRVADGPTGFQNSLKMTVTTTDSSLTGSNRYVLQHRFEGNNFEHLEFGTVDAKTVTLSFYVKSSLTGTFGGALNNSDANRSYAFTYTISSANTWERKTITITGDTTGTWPTGTSRAAQLVWSFGVGPDYEGTANTWEAAADFSVSGATNIMATNGATWQITGIQFEEGDSATPFEHLPYDVNLQRCLRYCWRPMYENSSAKYIHSQGGYRDANYVTFHVVPPVPMRAAPSVTEIGNVDVWSLNTDYTGFTWGFVMGIASGSEWYVSGNKTSHGISDTNMIYVVIKTQANGWLEYSAEL